MQDLNENSENGAAQPTDNATINWEARAAEYLTGWQRAQADYANLQRETAAQRAEMGAFATARVVSGFLPVYDYFKRALAHMPPLETASPSVQQWATGITHIRDLFKNTLAQLGVSEMETVGTPFDPATMEAVKEESRDGAVAHTVVEEIEGGYKMGDKIIKTPKVIVAQ